MRYLPRSLHTAVRPVANDPVAWASEIIVVLGGKRSQVARAEAAAALAHARPGSVVIVSGRAGFEPPGAQSEAEVMAAVLRREGIAPERVLLEDESRDTVGNALLTSARYLRGVPPRPLTIVTSPFHMERSLFIFRAVLGPRWTVNGHTSTPLPGDEERIPLEERYLADVHEMLAGTQPGDLAAIAARLRERWPEYYGAVARLDRDRLV
jgi:uncharacterized SAM-binding protein YcdF (DUF218 family)